MWRVCKEAGRPWPTLSEDSVIDYMVMEAVALKVAEADKQEEKAKAVSEWKSDLSELEQFR